VARWVAVAIGAGLVAWLVLGDLYILNPASTSHPRRADAIVVLGPSLPDRVAQAVRLAGDLGIGQLAVSIGDTSGQRTAFPCTGAPASLEVTCFVPAPYTTRGEAREIGTLAGERGWRSVIVIAPTPQLGRAHMLVRRCFGGTIQMVRAPEHSGVSSWIYQFFYQSAAYVKALTVARGC
jgi:uncharacterized SAM-binding protein YcdF (DUF218 family)